MKTSALQLALLLLMAASTAFCQSTRLGDSCDLSVLGAKDAQSFLAFDRELRAAITKQDAVAMAFLVQFPLRINSETGKYSLNDPAALQSRFQEVFPAAVRKAILDQKVQEISCRDEGIAYGNGDAWVNVAKFGFAIESINIGTPTAHRASNQRMEFACQTDKYRIVVDSDASRIPRYRAWNRPHPLTDNPDLEIAKGESGVDGTGLCAYPVWTFRSGKATYRIEGALGCLGDTEAPKEAKGGFQVEIEGHSKARGWCY